MFLFLPVSRSLGLPLATVADAGGNVPLWLVTPFVLLLLLIAVMPLTALDRLANHELATYPIHVVGSSADDEAAAVVLDPRSSARPRRMCAPS